MQLLNAREKVFRPQGNSLLEEIPSLSLSPSRDREVDGILNFRPKKMFLCDPGGPLCLCGKCFSEQVHHKDTKKHKGRRQKIDTRIVSRDLSFCVFTLIAGLLILSASCSNRGTQNPQLTTETREVTDEAGRRVRLPLKIERIVSLAPNLTEIVYAVGAGDRLVGRTKYCDYPPEVKNVRDVGDTMTPSIERIIAQKPQLVLVSTASQLEAFTKQLDQQQIAVYVTDPRSLDDVFRSITTLGDLLGTHDQAEKAVNDLRRRADAITASVSTTKPVKVFYQVSDEPLYTIGRESYLTDLVRRAGGVSVTAEVPTAFPRFSDEAALAARPEAIILPTGGSMGTANSTVAAALKNSPAVLSNRVYKINEDHLQRPGPRLVDGLEELARTLHPEVFK